MQQRVVGINRTAFAHRHMMRRIEAGCTNITNCTRQSSLAVNRIGTAKCIAVILHQPQIILIAECTDRSQVKRISKRMCNHNCLCLLTQRLFQLAYIQIILWNRQIQKNRNCTILQIWSNRGRKTCRNRDDFIPTLHTPLSQKWRSQRHKCQQICRRTGIDKRTKTHTNIICKFLFKLFCISTGSQPEFQRTVHKITHLILIVYPGSIRNAVSFLKIFFFRMKRPIISFYHGKNFFPCFFLCFMFKHHFFLSVRGSYTFHGAFPLSQSFCKYSRS